jgi:hypothetical protein
MQPTQDLIDYIYRQKVEAARAMSPEEKLLAGPRLFDMVCRVMRDGIRNQFPGISEDEVWRILNERLRIARELENRSCPPNLQLLP